MFTPKVTPTSLKMALSYLRSYPQVRINLMLFGVQTKISAIWERHDAQGLHFTITTGPAVLIGDPFILVIDGGDTEYETLLEFVERGFRVTRGEGTIEVLYRNQRPWQKGAVTS